MKSKIDMLQTLISLALGSFGENSNYTQQLKYNVCLQEEKKTNDLIIYIYIYS